jgi:hypothetical protein
LVALVPCEVVTVTCTTPTPAGTVHEIELDETTTTLVQGALPNNTVAPAEK